MKSMHQMMGRVKPEAMTARPQGNASLPRAVFGRRSFLAGLLIGSSAYALGCGPGAVKEPPKPLTPTPPSEGVYIPEIKAGEDIFAYIDRVNGKFDQTLYMQILGAANEFKEGDQAQGIHAADAQSRQNARTLLFNTKISDLVAHPIFVDSVSQFIEAVVDSAAAATVATWTMGDLKTFLLDKTEDEIKGIMGGLTSDNIACCVKLMSNDQLISVGQKVFNPLPGSNIGAKGYMGARIQPNSPTDNVDDIVFQVLDGWAYGVGDVVLGTNPVSSEVAPVYAIELGLQDLLKAFQLEDVMPHCVLAHIDVQAQVEEMYPGSTALWFQSLAGVEDANTVFDITVEKMKAHAAKRTGKYGLYFETGQGADATNGQGKGFDMVIHESRKYGFARALKAEVVKAQESAGMMAAPWVHLNDVAGFIGPEIFRSKEQLVRVCLEDIVMGKLHSLPIGLDICSTLHMEVTLDDLDWCIDQIMPANPAYLMGLPTKNDPMLSYLTTAYQDHVRIRDKFGYKVNDKMWDFFKSVGVIGADDQPGPNFGKPDQLYLAYLKAKNDPRTDAEILMEAQAKLAEIRGRGVFIAEGHGPNPWDMDPALDKQVRALYADAKKCLYAKLPADFTAQFAMALPVMTQSKDRDDYILHPPTGEVLDDASAMDVEALRDSQAGNYNVQIIISDGLDALAITDQGHLEPYLTAVRMALENEGYKPAPEYIVVTNARVRAGYRMGEMLYGSMADKNKKYSVLHIIGERPGNGHHTYSVYITGTDGNTWAQVGLTDHNITKVVANIADTALDPAIAADDTVNILKQVAPPI